MTTAPDMAETDPVSTAPLSLPVVTLPNHDPALPLPRHETDGAAGLDLCACLPPEIRHSGLTLPPLERALVPTGLALAIPDGHEGQIRPRSGLAARHGVTVLNSPGTIDCDYRGEVSVLLINLGQEPVTLQHGDRVAQLIIAPYRRAEPHPTATLQETDRGAGGFGSSGKR